MFNAALLELYADKPENLTLPCTPPIELIFTTFDVVLINFMTFLISIATEKTLVE